MTILNNIISIVFCNLTASPRFWFPRHAQSHRFCWQKWIWSIPSSSYEKPAVPLFDVMWLAGSPLWSKERNEAIVVQMGVSLVLQCRPPAGLPPPVIFWMDNSEPFASTHICTHSRTFHNQYNNGRQTKEERTDGQTGPETWHDKSNKHFTHWHFWLFLFRLLQISRSYRWINECPRLWTETCTSRMSSQKTAGRTTSATLASLTHKPSSRSSQSQWPCWTVSRDVEC